MRAIASVCSTRSSKGPKLEILQLLAATKSIVMNKGSHQDFYSVDSGGSLCKGD